ncbi:MULTISPECIES: AMP-binding protein [unclassified Rhodococcus (in: high G+C Gram-positive bacteria)]|uniref:AMP-binding protein n=1 Tax=unclassified Rhodococcus (in: high G+C Gram-positive bacteria) TaxID=192944 RepID=UPI002078794F|nr:MULTISPECIES: AMP-binding protein [unclassified Rhodococcus (in: high G+C Gram-positive bacteria)]
MAVVADRYSISEVTDFYDSGDWLRDSFFDMIERQSAERGASRFVFDDHRSLTFSEFRHEVVRLAVGFRRLGVGAGDRVVVQLPNWVEFAVAAAAVSRVGAVIVPMMPIYRDEEVEYILRHCGARFAVTCEEWKGFSHRVMFSEMIARCDNLEHVLIVRGATDEVPGTSLITAHLADGEPDNLLAELGTDPGPDEGFLIVYTSGTTARPKGCFHTVNTVRASAIAIARSLEATSEDVQFGPSPITHSTGLMTSVILPLLVGAQSYLMESWTPAAAVAKVAQHRCTVAVTATAFLQMFLGALENRSNANTLRQWVCAGSPIPGAVVERARRELSGCQVLSLYGRSESFLNAMCASDDAPELSASTDGRPRGSASLRVVDAQGEELPRGEIGDIAYKGPSHMLEYFQNSDETAALAAADGFARSGDLGYMTADGYVRVTGRTKDIVIRGGLNISARELEDHLIEHRAIEDVAVVGMPDERLGEKVCAFVIVARGHQAPGLDELVDFLRARRVATPKLPQRLEVVTQFPATATGKVKKHELRQRITATLESEKSAHTERLSAASTT